MHDGRRVHHYDYGFGTLIEDRLDEKDENDMVRVAFDQPDQGTRIVPLFSLAMLA